MAAVLRLVGEGERESRNRNRWGVIAVIQMRDNSGSDQGHSGKGGEKWPDSKCILKVELEIVRE